ncbi:hypothetical protein HAX54_043886 [Datura stramonium]|uniref:Uncharacterized protein n=1 Tax=Datura stramonium TaxID=4076 RepID=A0ABS8SQ48_DATST|nr:hypothetical protein [Datura stramonium]
MALFKIPLILLVSWLLTTTIMATNMLKIKPGQDIAARLQVLQGEDGGGGGDEASMTSRDPLVQRNSPALTEDLMVLLRFTIPASVSGKIYYSTNKYGKSIKKGMISSLSIDESRFTQVDEFKQMHQIQLSAVKQPLIESTIKISSLQPSSSASVPPLPSDI